MKYYHFSPQITGEFGRDNVMGPETDKHANVIEFDLMLTFWPEDDIVDSYATYAVTPKLAGALQSEKLSGFEIHSMKVSRGEQFWTYKRDHPGEKIPELVWLRIVGIAGADDFGELPGPGAYSLVVSESALNILKQFKCTHARIFDYVPGGERPMSDLLKEFFANRKTKS